MRPAQPFRIQLSRSSTRRAFITLSSINIVLTATTVLFMAAWARMDELGPSARWWVKYVLVQGHLATENVVAAWYSSTLLLLVALLAGAAFLADRHATPGRLRYGWLLMAAAFAVLSLDEIGSFHERIGMVPSLSGSGRPAGWMYVLALPMAGVGLFLGAFAWLHLRTVPRALGLMCAGVGLFLLNPVLEALEMSLIHGAGAQAGTWQRHVHDLLLVLEEGGLELFGILLFLGAVTTYLRHTADGAVEIAAPLPMRFWTVRALVVLLAGGALVAAGVVARLPPGDTGIAQNWFAAVAWLLVALLVWRRSSIAASVALAVSAAFGAGLYGYVDALRSSASWHLPLAGVLVAGLTLELLLRWDYRLSLSPRSLTASPTLRRPRPNPS